jgi:hypothetical protein
MGNGLGIYCMSARNGEAISTSIQVTNDTLKRRPVRDWISRFDRSNRPIYRARMWSLNEILASKETLASAFGRRLESRFHAKACNLLTCRLPKPLPSSWKAIYGGNRLILLASRKAALLII